LRPKRLLLTAGVLLVSVLAAIAIAAVLLVPRWLAPKIAEAVKAATGRELSVGEVAVTLLPRPALLLSQVRFANATWGSQPWLAQVDRASAELDVLALLSGRLRIRHVMLTDATLVLETDSAGTGNWVMGSADAAKPASPEALAIEKLTLQSLAFTWRDGKTGNATSLQIDSAAIAATSGAHSVELSTRATFNGKSVEMAGTVGPLSALIANTPYPVDLEGKFGAASVSVHGSIDKPHELGGFNLALKANAVEIADVVALFGATVPAAGPLRGAAQLSGALAAPVFAGIDVAAGTPGRMALTARGEVSGKHSAAGGYEWQSSGIDVLFEGAQFSDLAPWVGTSLPALGAYRLAARVAGTPAAPSLPAIDIAIGASGTPQITLRGSVADLRNAGGIDVKLAASAADWWRLGKATGGQHLPPFRASARVRGTRQSVQVDELALIVAGSTVNASLQVVRGGPRLRVTGKLTSPLIDLARGSPASGGASAPTPAPPATPSAAAASPRSNDHWKLADFDLELQIARLVFPGGRELRSGSGRLTLEDGRLNSAALKATLGGANVKLDGSVADPANLTGIDVNVALQGSELAELSAFFGKPVPPLGPYQGQARLQGSLDALRLTAFDASAGRPGQRLRATGQIDDLLHAQGLALAVTAEVNDSAAAGRLFGADLPRLPALRATARVSGAQGGYVLDDLKLALGRTSVQGNVLFAPGEPRPRITVKLSAPLVDLSELPRAPSKPGASNPALTADVDADISFDRLVLPDRRALGPVSGVARLTAGALELKQFSAALDGASLTMDGRIGDPLKPAALDLMLNAEVKRGAGLAAFTGLNLRELPAFTASAKLTDVAEGYALSGLKIVGAATTLAGDLALTRGAKRFKVSTKLHSALLDGSALVQPAAADGSTVPPVAGRRAIFDLELPVDALRAIDADVELRIDGVKLGDGAAFAPLLARVLIDDGRLKAEPVQLGGAAGQMLSVSAMVDAAQAAWDLRVEAKGFELEEMFKRFGRPGVLTGGRTELALQLQARGKTLQALLGSLQGEARVQVGPLHLRNVAINLDRGIVAGAIGLANPFQKTDPDTDFECVAARVPIKNGVLTSDQGIAAETTKYNLVLNGSVNLRTEAIDVAMTPVVKGGLGVGSASIAGIVRVGGTLGAPTLGVDAAGAAKLAVNAGVAVVAAPVWLADVVLKKARSDPNPCATALGTQK